MNKLSVFETMRAMWRLWKKHFRLMLVIAAAQSVLLVANDAVTDSVTVSEFTFVPPVLYFTFYLLGLVVGAVCRATVLGVLAEPLPEMGLTSMRLAIRTRTWPLFRVSILLALIAIPFGALIGFIATPLIRAGMSYFATISAVVLGVLYLVFLKYALADPLVVTKGFGARESLKISWRMTRGHFGYVLLCYLLLGVILVVVSLHIPDFDSVGHIVKAIVYEFINALLGTTWIVLAWVMYQRIIEADAQPVGLAPATPAPEVG